jgi:hypothetical protein
LENTKNKVVRERERESGERKEKGKEVAPTSIPS